MGLPDLFDQFASPDLSVELPAPAWPAVAVLIRSLSTVFGVTHHSPVVAVSSQAGTDQSAPLKEALISCLQNLSTT